MTPRQKELLDKAEESLLASKLLLENKFYDYSVSRSYYTMFYVAEAFLEGEGKNFSSHSAVISAFGKEFTKTNKVPLKLHGFLLDAQDLRHTGDYGQFHALNYQQAQQQITNAELFLSIAKNSLI
ncbi:HEPN domain-containing protein [Geminocystis sp. CENA526]|uniref:HEPN domain-containing protein n=1 Tax=Geminocystis sp. CENA526 TaxID=1355871 RepID=UPI003D7015C1